MTATNSNTTASSSSDSSGDSIFSCWSSEFDELTPSFFQDILKTTESGAEVENKTESDSEDEITESSSSEEDYNLVEDWSKLPKFDHKGKRINYRYPGKNFMGQHGNRFSDKMPATKERMEQLMRRVNYDDTKLPNYSQTAEERENLRNQGVDFILNPFGEVIRLDQISDAELKTIIGKKALMKELSLPGDNRPRAKFNLFKEPKKPESKPNPIDTDGFH